MGTETSHATGGRARHVVRIVMTVVAIAVLGTIGLSIRSADRHSSQPPAASGQPQQRPAGNVAGAPPVQAPEALVTQMLDDLRAGKKVTSEDDPLAGAPILAVKTKAGVTSPIGRIQIPKLHVNQRVFNGVDDAALLNGPGHWPGTPLPGQKGNAVISGHRGTHTHPFLYVNKLASGDQVIVTAGGTTTHYTVKRVVIVPQAKYVPFVLKQPGDPKAELLTLFACNPLTSHEQRIVVQAEAHQ